MTDSMDSSRQHSAHRRPAPPQGGGRGVVAMLTVVIIGALIVMIGISAAFLAQTETVITGNMDRGYHARTLATACAEEALYRLKPEPGFTSATIPIDGYACAVTVTGTGSARTITATATSGDHAKTVIVGATLRMNSAASARAWVADSWEEADP